MHAETKLWFNECAMKILVQTKGLLTVAQVAELCGVTVQAVYKWQKNKFIPPEYCRAIELATEGRVTRYELNPDVFGTSCDCHLQRESA